MELLDTILTMSCIVLGMLVMLTAALALRQTVAAYLIWRQQRRRWW